MQSISDYIYTFGEFILDLRRGCLSRTGREIRLRPKSFEALKYLVENRGRLIGKEEMMRALWPDSFVTDGSLVQCLRDVRLALEDDEHRYIRTVPRRGYIFIAEVVENSRAKLAAPEPGKETVSPLRESAPQGAASSIKRPQTRYTRSGDMNIAYQVVGDGPVDLVYIPGWVTHIEYCWEEPSLTRYYNRLASFSRLILFDKRGTGLSDRPPGLQTMEERMDDVRAVMDAVGSERAVVFGASEGGILSMLFAATYPERSVALVLLGTFARGLYAPDYPWARTSEEWRQSWELMQQRWGHALFLTTLAPGVVNDKAFREWWAAYLRHGASPGAAVAFTKMSSQMDVRRVLPSISIPTLVIHRVGDLCEKVEGGRYLASNIPGAKLVEVPGNDHLAWIGPQDEVLDPVEAFLTDLQSVPIPDRVVATVMFASVTSRSDEQKRRDFFSQYHARVGHHLARFRGRAIENTGDSLLATFDGPARAIGAASAIIVSARRLGFVVKVGLHTGECDFVADRVSGTAVEIGREVGTRAATGEILVSSTVKDLVAGSGIRFEDRGVHILKEAPGEWRFFAVEAEPSPG